MSWSWQTIVKKLSWLFFVCRKNLTENLDQFNYYADKFEQVPMYLMTFHGEENIRKVIAVRISAVRIGCWSSSLYTKVTGDQLNSSVQQKNVYDNLSVYMQCVQTSLFNSFRPCLTQYTYTTSRTWSWTTCSSWWGRTVTTRTASCGRSRSSAPSGGSPPTWTVTSRSSSTRGRYNTDGSVTLPTPRTLHTLLCRNLSTVSHNQIGVGSRSVGKSHYSTKGPFTLLVGVNSCICDDGSVNTSKKYVPKLGCNLRLMLSVNETDRVRVNLY